MITFRVMGIPKGQPRPRAASFGGKARVYDPRTAESWKEAISWVAKHHRPEEPITGPVAVDLTHYMPRPKAHFNKHGVKPDAPFHHTGKPDTDNLAKAALDCLTQLGFWRDDSQVCSLAVSKEYSEQPGARIVINPMSAH